MANVAQIFSAKDKDGNPAPKDKDSTPGNGFDKGEDDDDDETIFFTPCPIPPTPTCLDVAANICPEQCVNLMDFVESRIRTVGGKFEWHTSSLPSASTLIADSKACRSGSYYLFEKAACGEYSNAAILKVTIKPCDVPKADLSLVKTVNNKTPEKGNNVTYSITVSNAGPATATNVEVTDKLPAGLEFVSSTNMTLTAGTLTGKATSIAKDASVTFSYVAKVIGESGSIKNFAEVSKSDQPDPNSTPGNGNGTPREGDEDDETITIKVLCPVPPTPT
ncbi:MAG: DUF11 domain-containing protein, partial [Runella slithyformis]